MRRALARLRHVLAILVICLGGLTLFAYALTPLLADWRDEVAGYLSEQLGRPVSLGGLQARWRGIGPALQLKDLVVGDPQADDSLRLERVDLDVGVLDMLLHRNLSPLRITLHRLHLHLVRQPDGSIQLAGDNPLGGADATAPDFTLPARLRLRDVELVWEDRKKGIEPLRLPQAQLDLDLRGGRLQVAAKLSTANVEPNHILFIADLDGMPWSADWSGDIYLAVHGLNSQSLPAAYLPASYQLQGVAQDIELWSHWRQAELQQLQGRIDLLDVSIGQGKQRLQLDDLRGQLHAQRLPQGWSLQLEHFSLSHRGISWPAGSLALQAVQDNRGHWTLDAGADFLRLQDLAALYLLRPAVPELTEALQQLAPGGDLRDLRLQLRLGEQATWRFSARLADFESRPWAGIPGISGLSVGLHGDQRQLLLKLDSTQTELRFGKLFRQPIRLDTLSGELRLQRDEAGGLSVSSDEIIARNPDIQTRSRLRLDIPAGHPQQAQIDLQTDFHHGVATVVPHYLPTGIMTKPLVHWLDNAFVSGHIPAGTLLLRGPLDKFPFDKGRSGHFEVLFGVEELVLNYQPDWPHLIDSTAELRFHNNSLDIDLQQGRIYGSEVKRASARIAQLDPTSAIRVRGLVRGPLADPLRLLAESPLRKDFGQLVSNVKASGNSELALDFELVLDKLGKDRLDGKLRLLDAGLALPAWELAITQLRGELQLDLAGVRASGLRGKVLDGIDIVADITARDDDRTWVDSRLRLDIDTIAKRLPQLPRQWLSGSSEFQISVGIPNSSAPDDSATLLSVESALQGIAIALPPPLGKRAQQTTDFRFHMPIAGGDDILTLRYGKDIDAAFTRDGRRSGIRFGGGTATLPTAPGLHLRGELAELDLEPWLALNQRDETTGTLPPLSTDLGISELRLGQFRLPEVRLQLSEDEKGWRGSAASPDFNGRFRIPVQGSRQPIQLDLERLALRHNPTTTPSTPPEPDSTAVSPMDWPELDLSCTQLLVNDNPLGQLELKLRKGEDGVSFSPLSLQGEQVRLQAEAGWRRLATNGHGESYLRGELTTPDLGRLLVKLGFSEQLKQAETELDFDLSWAGAPNRFDSDRLVGDLDLLMKKGTFLEVEPGVSRVFGLLNIGALQRRLSLDFRDLFGKGFSFDSASASFQLDKGDAYTNNLIIKGPSGEMDISGRIGLEARDFDQLVTVKPELGAALPIAVGTAAGPIAGVAVWLAQELIKVKEIDEFKRFQYSVKGPWDNPEVKQLDSGGGLSNLLKPVTEGLLGKPDKAAKPEGENK